MLACKRHARWVVCHDCNVVGEQDIHPYLLLAAHVAEPPLAESE